MEGPRTADRIALFAHLADLKEVDYRNTLAIAALLELLIDKQMITREEIAARAQALDRLAAEDLVGLE